MRRRALLVLAACGLGAAAPVAGAIDGPLYPQGESIWSVGAPFSSTVLSGPTWQIQAPALSSAAVGSAWEMNWGCPVAGSEVAAVQFTALRTQASSSLEVRVTGNRATLWSEPDGAIPQAPLGGRAYDVRLPSGHCNVHLMLVQVEQRAQHARGYFIGAPRILVRDVAPPSVAVRSVSTGWIGAGRPLHVEWSVGDNFGADGVGQQRVSVGGQVRWAGAPGVGSHAIDLGLDGLPDGVHRVDVVADGDGTGAGGDAREVSVDRTPPGAADLAAVAPGIPGVVTASWRAVDNLSGVASSQAQINSAPDGGTGGSWIALGGAGGPGPQSVTAAPAVPDGVHAWRVLTTDAAGNATATPGPAPVVVDATAPALELHGLPTGWINRLDLDLTATDALHGALGMGATEVDVNAASDGSESGEWLRRSTTTGPAGRRTVPVPLQGLASGRHALRVTARNGGPFSATLAAEVRGVLRVDLDAPVVSRASFSPGGERPMAVAWAADDALSGVAAATVQWRQGNSWRTLAGERAGDGAGSMSIDVSSLPNGQVQMRVVVADAAGNLSARTGTAEISGAGLGSIAGDPLGRLRAARLTVGVTGARIQRRAGRALLVRRITAGTPVRVHGVLRDRAGRAIVGAEIQVRGHRGRVIGRSLTRAGGRFAVSARPVGGGPLRIGVAAGRELLPHRTSADVRLDVVPRLEFAASSLLVPAGSSVVFSGRISPSPGELGLGARKSIVLEWRDPVRHAWRPIVNARLRGDGTFAIPWTFNLRGLTIPVRAVVPQDVGWPLLPVRSGVLKIRVA